MSTGSATDAHVSDIEMHQAIESILHSDHDYTLQNEKENKRKFTELEDDNKDNLKSPVDHNPQQHKKPHIQRLYKPENTGPFEVIVQDKKRNKINPFTIGIILKQHYTDIEHISRAGKNLSIMCSNFNAANNLVNSQHLLEYNVFVPSIRVHTIGVVYAEPEVSEQEVMLEASSTYPIIHAERIRRRVNEQLIL
uniref:Uncharacterized protein n=1 Tax=Graphocephala atropunctata TaxID=36148 RepID=A0A1B6LQ00_9HEMI